MSEPIYEVGNRVITSEGNNAVVVAILPTRWCFPPRYKVEIVTKDGVRVRHAVVEPDLSAPHPLIRLAETAD